MKKLHYSLIAAAAIALTACSSDEPAVNGGNGYQDGCVVFNVDMPGTFSRTVADGTSANDLYAMVYDADNGNAVRFLKAFPNAFQGTKEATVKIPLVNGKKYTIAFFAMNENAPYTINESNGVLSMNYGSDKANDDNYDAFYKAVPVTVSTGMGQQEVKLNRPVAQVNVGATDWADAKQAGYVVEQSALSFSAQVYTTMDLLTGKVDNLQTVNFDFNKLPDAEGTGDNLVTGKLQVGNDSYDYIAMAYVLVPTDKGLVDNVDFKYVGPDKNYTIPVTQVPVQRNWRTNIVGKFFTSDVDYKIIIDDVFGGNYIYSVAYEGLKAAAEQGGNVCLGADVEIPESLTVPAGKKLVVDLNGYNITCNKAGQDAFCVLGELEINGNGNVIADGDGSNYAVWARGDSKVTINGGTYMGHGATIQAKDNAQIVINDGYFKVYAPYDGRYFVLNLQDNQPNTITVNGGLFENFNPADTKTEPSNPTSFLGAGKKSTKVQNDPVVYKVVDADDNRAYALDSATLDEAANTPGAEIVLAGPLVALESSTTFANNVKVTGDGADVSTIKVDPSTGNHGLLVQGKGVQFADLTIDGTAVPTKDYSSAINIEANGCEVKDCVVRGGGNGNTSSSVLVESLKEGESFKMTNTEVYGAFRGLYIESQLGDIYVDNCVLAPQCYALNVDGGGNFGLYVTNTTLKGWTSYSTLSKGAHFTGCTFQKNTLKGSYGYNVIAAYCDTYFTDCNFAADFEIYAQKTGFTFVLNNCIKDGVKVTAENFKTLFPKDSDVWNKCVCVVDGVTVAKD